MVPVPITAHYCITVPITCQTQDFPKLIRFNFFSRRQPFISDSLCLAFFSVLNFSEYLKITGLRILV